MEGLTSGYGHSAIVHGASLALDRSRILAVLGPNGSGKSTLVRCIAGLLPAWEGRITLEGRDVTALRAPARARAGLAYVPQEANVFPNLSVAENLRLATEFLVDIEGERRARRQSEVLGVFPDLAGRLPLLAGELSGGQRQMLALASALMGAPRVLLLDEPSAGLSPRYVDEILATVRRINRSGVPIVMVEQNVRAALDVAHEALILVAGRVRVRAPAEALRAREDLPQLFLGTAP